MQMRGIGPDGHVSLTTAATATPSGDGFRVSESITRMHAYKLVKELMRNSQANGYMGRQREAEKERASALAIALEAGLLWPGLTSMLVVADETCKKKMISEVCTKTTEDLYNYDSSPS